MIVVVVVDDVLVDVLVVTVVGGAVVTVVVEVEVVEGPAVDVVVDVVVVGGGAVVVVDDVVVVVGAVVTVVVVNVGPARAALPIPRASPNSPERPQPAVITVSPDARPAATSPAPTPGRPSLGKAR